MAGDLEDFLRRAAQRRQQKAAQQKQQRAEPPRRQQPEYTDSRTERIPRSSEPDEPILSAEAIDAVMPESHARQLRQAEEAERAAEQAKQKAARAKRKEAERKRAIAATTGKTVLTGNPSVDLINLIRSPGGIQQAILLREIFDRPEHRW